jgi:hypothetical protein
VFSFGAKFKININQMCLNYKDFIIEKITQLLFPVFIL